VRIVRGTDRILSVSAAKRAAQEPTVAAAIRRHLGTDLATAKDPPMTVTVLLITYNHEHFIKQAIESVLMQQVKCEYEIVIIEDCSTDKTRDIVSEYQRRHPNKIRLVLSVKNEHNTKALASEILNAKGRYIALLDGDDFWTSPHKLQTQIEFLDGHLECAVCFHNTTIFDEDHSDVPSNSNLPSQKFISTLDDLWIENFISTCSVMFRTRLFDAFPPWFDSMRHSADWTLHILNAQHGKIGYINQLMGAYRRHCGGMWTGLSKIQQMLRVIDFYERMDVNFRFAYHTAIKSVLYDKCDDLCTAIRAATERRDLIEMTRGFIGLLRYFPGRIIAKCWSIRYRFVMLCRYPVIYRLAAGWRRILGRKDVKYEGFLEAADCNLLRGWAWDSNSPNSPIDVEIWEGQHLLSRAPANIFSRDLVHAGKGNGYHAFCAPLPAACRDGSTHLIHVKMSGCDLVQGSPIEIKR